MIKMEQWETGTGKDAGDIIAKALKHSERYVRMIAVGRIPSHAVGGKTASQDRDRYAITIKYGHDKDRS